MADTAIDVGYSNLDEAPERESPEPFPAGTYNFQIVEAEMKTTDKGGKRLAYKAEVVDGEFERRKVFGGINIINANPDAQKIGQAELAELAKAIKLPEMPRDTSDLLYKLFTAKVKITPARTDKATGKEYSARNEITKFMFYGGEEVARRPAGASPATTPATTARPGGSSRPWENK